MSFRTLQRLFAGQQLARYIASLFLLVCFAVAGHAASIRGVVTDASGARVTGATVDLISNGSVVGSAVSGADGSFQIMTGLRGRFFLVVSATKFRQLETPGFYAGQLDNIERNLVLGAGVGTRINRGDRDGDANAAATDRRCNERDRPN